MTSKSSKDQLLRYFLSLLARRDYSERELQQKVADKEYPADTARQALDFLKEKNYLNEERLAENIVEHYGQVKGRKWLEQKLQGRRVKQEVIQKVLQTYNEPVPNNLKQKVAGKYKIYDWTELEPQTKQKILGYLARQGFSSPYEILKAWQAKD